jgi:hypothetical protein
MGQYFAGVSGGSEFVGFGGGLGPSANSPTNRITP